MLGGFNIRQAMRLQKMAQKSMKGGKRGQTGQARAEGEQPSNRDAWIEGGKAAGKMGLRMAMRQVINQLIRGVMR